MDWAGGQFRWSWVRRWRLASGLGNGEGRWGKTAERDDHRAQPVLPTGVREQ